MSNNPFIFGKIAEGNRFTDREVERKRIINNVKNNINTILISPRRWGKSSLVSGRNPLPMAVVM